LNSATMAARGACGSGEIEFGNHGGARGVRVGRD
jgi:hypothetical protein